MKNVVARHSPHPGVNSPSSVRPLGWPLLALVAATAPFLASATGCSTYVHIHSLEPGPVNIGGATRLTLLETQGRRSARETVSIELERQARSRGYFAFEDATEEGVRMRLLGRRGELEGASAPLATDQAGVRFDVHEWTAFRDEEPFQRQDEAGKAYTELVPVRRGKALVSFTLLDSGGRLILAEKEYEGIAFSEDLQISQEELLELASGELVARFLDDLTPRSVVSRVRLDDDDPGQEPILEIVADGNLALAVQDLTAYVEKHPNNPSAAYNLAVLLDAQGEYEEALKNYNLALSRSSKKFYRTARTDCARRLAAANDLTPEALPNS